MSIGEGESAISDLTDDKRTRVITLFMTRQKTKISETSVSRLRLFSALQFPAQITSISALAEMVSFDLYQSSKNRID